MIRVFGYCWTDDIADDPTEDGPDWPGALIRAAARRRCWAEPATYLEERLHAVAPFEQRPNGGKLFSNLSPGSVLIVPDHSYLFRSARQGMTFLPKLADRKVQVYSIGFGAIITAPETIDLFMRVLRPFAESETDAHSLSIRAQKRQATDAGRYLGGKVPFGFRLAANGMVEKDRAQQAAIRKILILYKEGRSLRSIAQAVSSTGTQISHVGVASIIKNHVPESLKRQKKA